MSRAGATAITVPTSILVVLDSLLIACASPRRTKQESVTFLADVTMILMAGPVLRFAATSSGRGARKSQRPPPQRRLPRPSINSRTPAIWLSSLVTSRLRLNNSDLRSFSRVSRVSSSAERRLFLDTSYASATPMTAQIATTMFAPSTMVCTR